MKLRISYKSSIIVIPYIWLVTLVLLPFLLVLIMSFNNMRYDILPGDWFFNPTNLFNDLSFDNYKFIFSQPIYRETFLESLQIALMTTVITLIISYPTAYGIYKAESKYRNILLMLIVVPFWTSLLIRVYAWMILLKNNGVINNFLLHLGLISEPIQLMNSKFAVIMGLVYSYMPFMVLPLYSSLEKINPALMEAAEDLGSGPLSSFLHVTLPLCIKGIVAGCLLVFIPCIGELVIPELLGGAKIVTISKVLWIEFFYNRNWPLAAAISVLMILIVLVPIYLIERIFINDKK